MKASKHEVGFMNRLWCGLGWHTWARTSNVRRHCSLCGRRQWVDFSLDGAPWVDAWGPE